MPNAADGKFLVGSEKDALDLLDQALNGSLRDVSPQAIVWNGWPALNIHLPKTSMDGSISPAMMEAFISVQQSLYRTQALLQTKSQDLRSFTQEEKEGLEFRVKVEKGSSDYFAELIKPIENLATSLGGKMTPEQSFVSVLVVAILIAGGSYLQSWLKYKADKRKDEIKSAEAKDRIEAQTRLMEHDERNAELIVRALREQPQLASVQAVIEPARQSVVQAIGNDNGGTYQGVSLTPEFADEVLAQKRQRAAVEELTGIYRVGYVDTTTPEGFRVTFVSIDNNESISANLQDILVSDKHRSMIREAEWTKQPIKVSFTAKRLRGKVVEATVRDVQAVPVKPAAVN